MDEAYTLDTALAAFAALRSDVAVGMPRGVAEILLQRINSLCEQNDIGIGFSVGDLEDLNGA